MKQGTLSFTSTKRTGSSLDTKSKKQAAPSRLRGITEEKLKITEKGEDILAGDTASTEFLEISSSDDTPTIVPTKRTRDGTRQKRSSRDSDDPPKEAEDAPVAPERENLDVEDKADRYRRYYNEAREKLGYIDPIHSNGQNKIHMMLRFFDMSYEYGPCVGMTRLERWERAETLGLNPPSEVRHILLTKEGIEKEEYAQCVLYGEV
ncbi:hypothetical protein ID866_4818 [Astraeus odoratus]|nr:hypothetical protein ID866_4818 [Astraeus odoratus]